MNLKKNIMSILSVLSKTFDSMWGGALGVLLSMLLYHAFFMATSSLDGFYYMMMASDRFIDLFFYIITVSMVYFSFTAAGIGVIIGTIGLIMKPWKLKNLDNEYA